MFVEYKKAFDRDFKKLAPLRQEKVKATIKSLLDYFEHQTSLKPGLGLKNFEGDYWEIRVDIRDRIIFELTDKVIFWLVGNHNDIRRFIRRH